MYLDMFQDNRISHQFSLRTTGNPYSIAATARRAVGEVLKTIPVTRITTLSDQVDAAIVPERLIATLSQSFGALGAVLAGIGLYGLLAYAVARRINEIGVRVALAPPPATSAFWSSATLSRPPPREHWPALHWSFGRARWPPRSSPT